MKETTQKSSQQGQKPRYYLAYGSNLNPTRIKDRCPTAKRVGSGVIQNYRLMFRRSKSGYYLSIDPCEGSQVPVGIYEVQSSDEERLDSAEGYPTWYGKKSFRLRLAETGEEIEGFAYLLPMTAPIGSPSEEYVGIVRIGYESFEFDERYLNEAIALSKRGKE